MKALTGTQRKVFIGCFVVYAGAYVARLNLASALPAIVTAFSLTDAQAGLIQTLFALVYASGQLVNGAVVDKVSPRRYILAGLLASAACNFLFGAATAYWQLLLLWALNGAAQSMLWTPVVRLLAGWFDEQQRKHVSMWVAFSAIGGHFVAWAISGYMAQLFTWRLSFIVPGLTQLIFVGLTLWLIHDPTEEFITAARGDRNVQAMPIKTMLLGTGLIMTLLCCAAGGYVRDGVMTWGPTILTSLQTGGQKLSAATISLVIPSINLLGVVAGQVLLRRARGNTRLIVAVLMAAGSVVSGVLILAAGGSLLVYALLLGTICALMTGLNPLETVVLPMDYARFGRVGLAAGLIDGSVYVGSALVSLTGGLLKDMYGLQAMFGAWAVVAALGAVCMLLSIKGARALE